MTLGTIFGSAFVSGPATGITIFGLVVSGLALCYSIFELIRAFFSRRRQGRGS